MVVENFGITFDEYDDENTVKLLKWTAMWTKTLQERGSCRNDVACYPIPMASEHLAIQHYLTSFIVGLTWLNG